MLTMVHYNEAYLVSELCPSFHIRKGRKNLGKRWATALSAASTGVQTSTPPKMEAETDQRTENFVFHKKCNAQDHRSHQPHHLQHSPNFLYNLCAAADLLGKFNGSPHHSPRINRHKSTRWNDIMKIMKLLFPSSSSFHLALNTKRFVPRH